MFDIGGYAELHARSAYSFGEGVDQPADLVSEAARLGLTGLAITDRDGLYATVQAHRAARDLPLALIHGAELTLADGTRLPILARTAAGYARLSRTISRHNLAAGSRATPAHDLTDLADAATDWLVLTGDDTGPLRTCLARSGPDAAARWLDHAIACFGAEAVAVETCLTGSPGEAGLADALADLADSRRLPLVATTGARCANAAGQHLADVVEARRMRVSLEEAWGRLPTRHARLRSPEQMARLHNRHPRAVATSVEIARECAFGLDLIAPELPRPDVPDAHTPHSWLSELTWRGVRRRYGDDADSAAVRDQITRELALIGELGFSGYFLIVHEIVEFCRAQGILTQGRGSAANSAVCYALGITAVDAVRHKLHFERFLSPGRVGMPDIDLDIEANRREDVIAHVYARYGREQAAQVGTVISYRPRSALRDVARVMGYDEGTAEGWMRQSFGGIDRDPFDSPTIPRPVADVARRLQRLPRHMGIHSGGMVLCDRPVIDVCPVTWANTPGRSVLQWDKDDCADAGLVKFDLLGLGMLTALRLAFTSLTQRSVAPPRGTTWDMASLNPEDDGVFDLLQRADTVGVFQVESRAQMSVLPRLKPQTFYDIVIAVALVRPGPIQGQAVNPYLRRRRGREAVTYPHPLTKRALEKTLGVALFQEQLMQLAEDAAGFSPSQADELRKAMGAKRSAQRMAALKPALFAGMAERGIDEAGAEQIWRQLQGFADFGFPESHAFSFAGIVYASAWLKVHYPEDFYAAVLAAQPLGFYSPLTLVEDARRHGVRVHPADVNYSQVDACVEADPESPSGLAVRLGLAPLKGLGKERARIIVEARATRPYASMEDVATRTRLPVVALETLAESGAMASLNITRRAGMWAAGGVAQSAPTRHGWVQEVLPETAPGATAPPLVEMSAREDMIADIRTGGVSHSGFPTAFIRDDLHARGIRPLSAVTTHRCGERVTIAGIITHRQRPHTAVGTTFLSLQDETGLVNVVCSAGMWERFRPVVTTAPAVVIRGRVERGDGARSVVAEYAEPLEVSAAAPARNYR
ncbi:error-prone DNA polymerase [Nanchangia anserum]|uniref:Error-prone DNA polymerase n=1 Tax=Nanchangia anserum TaxID=2692125 RepID=A0A8I0KQQ0_9ACTO|nr:error-prone DNA polymerase [Nanchangia anserum]MBD3688672.1 error-prone DNA polymerase [Nanchangia anserum]QOX82426.1 error-prone DNA polymerase [Nanchangia anserum]